MGAQKTRLAKGAQARPQLLDLLKWGESLAKGQLVAVNVDRADRHLEGGFGWRSCRDPPSQRRRTWRLRRTCSRRAGSS